MKVLVSASVRICITSAILSACGGPAAPPGVAAAAPQSVGLKAAKSGNALLYVSTDYYGTVSIYTYPQGKLSASFDVPGVPSGMCSDTSGHVFIAEGYAGIVAEYAHGGTTPIATFSLSPSPYSCAVDPTTGNLAATSEAGKVGVFDPNSSGSPPTLYTYPGVQGYYFCSYDGQGDLFAVGYSSGAASLLELKKGAAALKPVKVPFKLSFAAAIQWDGTYLAVGASHTRKEATIDRLEITHFRAKVKGRVLLKGVASYTSEFWIQSGAIISPNYYNENVAWWKYPQGGQTEKTITNVDHAFGLTISAASRP
ncbi:MAG TPA: hypothetical protein VIX83_13860 [Candidatus Cybelea sp.]